MRPPDPALPGDGRASIGGGGPIMRGGWPAIIIPGGGGPMSMGCGGGGPIIGGRGLGGGPTQPGGRKGAGGGEL